MKSGGVLLIIGSQLAVACLSYAAVSFQAGSPTEVAEGASVVINLELGSVQGTDSVITLDTSRSYPFSDEFSLPASITIPSGQTQGSFTLSATDDAQWEGREPIIIRAVFNGTTVQHRIDIPSNDLPGSGPVGEPAGMGHISGRLGNLFMADGTTKLRGQGIKFHMYEANVPDFHADFGCRLINLTGVDPSTHDHAIHTAGHLISDGTNSSVGMGLCSESTLEAISAHVDNKGYYNYAPDVLNVSYGGWNSSGYSYTAMQVDWYIYENDVFVVNGAGNATNRGTIFDVGAGLNAVSVSALGDEMGITPNLRTSASRGPVSDSSGLPVSNRMIKPDVATQGYSYSTDGASGLISYSTAGGTSIAAPILSGYAGILMQKRREVIMSNDPTLLKGLLIHHATDDHLRAGPDYDFGWGVISERETYDALQDLSDVGKSIRRIKLDISSPTTSELQIPIQVTDSSVPLKLTASWKIPTLTSALGALPVGAYARTQYFLAHQSDNKLTNDIDIHLIAPDGTKHYPWVHPYQISGAIADAELSASRSVIAPGSSDIPNKNKYDSVEQCLIDNPAVGEWTLVVEFVSNSIVEFTTQKVNLMSSHSFGSDIDGDEIEDSLEMLYQDSLAELPAM